MPRVETAAAKSLQSCLTLCDPIDSSPPGFPVPGILQARTLEWVAISFSNAWSEKWKGSRSVVSDSSNPMDCSPQGSSVHGIFQAKVTGVGCHCPLREWRLGHHKPLRERLCRVSLNPAPSPHLGSLVNAQIVGAQTMHVECKLPVVDWKVSPLIHVHQNLRTWAYLKTKCLQMWL